MRVASLLELSPRQTSRLLLALRAPAEIQSALERSEISVVGAGNVAQLPEDQTEQIVGAIRRGEDPKKVVKAHLRRRKTGRATRRRCRKHFEVIAAAIAELDEVPQDRLILSAKECGVDVLERVRGWLEHTIALIRNEWSADPDPDPDGESTAKE